MDFAKVILENGTETEVKGLFYIYNSCYYFLYTEKEFDEKGYVILKLVQVGKEVKKAENGTIETGYMIGVEPSDWENAKKSITLIVDDKKNSTQSSDIKYLPINMLATLKVSSHKIVKFLKNIVEQYFNVEFENDISTVPIEANPTLPLDVLQQSANDVTSSATSVQEVIPTPVLEPSLDANISSMSEVTPVIEQSFDAQPSIVEQQTGTQVPLPAGDDGSSDSDSDVIIDYRKSFFEEQEKNKELEARIQELTEKLNRIKEIME